MEGSASSTCHRRRLGRRLALAGAALAAPAVAHALIRRQLRAPDAPGWGRTHRYAGRFGPAVYQELGAGPPVVLLHALGPGYDGSQWRAAAEALAPDFRVLVPDLPGWGRSAPIEARPQAYLAFLADFLAGVVWGRAVLVAAGHAAPFAIHLAAERSTVVRGLALVAPLGLSMDAGSEHFAEEGPGEPLAGQDATDGAARPCHPLVAHLMGVPLLRESVLDALTSRAVLGGYLRNQVYAAGERVDAALLEHHYRVSHRQAHRAALAAYWRGDLALPAAATLRGLELPVWIGLGGEDEASWPDPDDLPPGARVEAIAGTRALPHAEKPVAVSQALARFLAELPAAAG